ncbi:MAG: 50S ribosomal protein L11 methyltransferase [Devosiaceae bacterium]|nr:50S ribosomal protein L11 methyltransferase [Devosiaceae bacterium]
MSQNHSIPAMNKEQVFALVDAVSLNENLTLSASAFEDKNGEWVFEATCDGAPDIEKFTQIARKTLAGNVTFTAEKIDPEINWVERSLKDLKPVTAGGFYIYAGHNKGQPPKGTIPILIEAAQAFGTGHHQTTSGCLLAIHSVLKNFQPKRIIDIGTGTGVLAIALAKRLQRKIIASDNDPIAVKTTGENAQLNNVGNWIKPILAEGLKSEKIVRNGPYDLIVANILAAPLVLMTPDIARSANAGAAIIMSGILTSQAEKIIAACAEQQIALNQRIILDEWCTLVFEKI